MALEITNLKRAFKFKKDGEMVNLPDPNVDFTAAEVLQFYSMQHPVLTTATIAGPSIEEDKAVYEFKTTVGTKG
ncbi:PRTRC system protein C [Chitinophaga jiangningensis]|uniref:PRTRC system protein C n=1 Tax=Chitinophaga jiangningensis TaxID=1419482 RepID=A0A1M6WIP1_9BACT|nr:PRTRC system protein C [Chitinophaga jiangningensis]SHK93541.1 PRTRC system protein C [Chitinophaga jiangningensis]